jgi:hypothetical protein
VSDGNVNCIFGIPTAENLYGRITVPHLKQQGESLFSMRNSDAYPLLTLLLFFVCRHQWGKNTMEIIKGSFERKLI